MTDVLALSPHLDDAVLSASDLLAQYPGSIVVTVFAGMPPATCETSEWDRACGFESSRESMTEREREDDAALAVLRARPWRLGYLDRQYGVPCSGSAILTELSNLVTESWPAVVAFPLGLHHPDHLTISDVVLQLRDSMAEKPIEWVAWSDVPYRAIPGVLEARINQLRNERDVYPWMTPVRSCTQKRAALSHYRSQLKALRADAVLDIDDTVRAEQYWSIGPRK